MSKSLPDQPSLEFERKQAKVLVRDFEAGVSAAVLRVREQLPERATPISVRDAQFVIAREYGYGGWPELKSAILEQSSGLEWAAAEARKAIDANDTARLSNLIAEHSDLLISPYPNDDDKCPTLLYATISYANFPGAENEGLFNRPDCARLLIDAGAIVLPCVYLRVIDTGAHNMLALLDEKRVLPKNLRTFAARGDLESVRRCFDEAGALMPIGRPDPDLRSGYPGAEADWPDPTDDPLIAADAFLYACRLGHSDVARFLLQRCMQFDDDLRDRIENWQGVVRFIDFLLGNPPRRWAELTYLQASGWRPRTNLASRHGTAPAGCPAPGRCRYHPTSAR